MKSLIVVVAAIILTFGPLSRAQELPATKPDREPLVLPTFQLPQGAVGFHFGNKQYPNFTNITDTKIYTEENGAGWVLPAGVKIWQIGNGYGWPTAFHCAAIRAQEGKEWEFKAKVPNGEYLLWLSAGDIINPTMKNVRYLLKANTTTLTDTTPTPDEFNSEKYLFRFMWTQYSEKPNFVWNAYLSKMWPAVQTKVSVTDGIFSIKACNQLLVAAILVPADKKADYDALIQTIEKKNLEDYHNSRYMKPAERKPPRGAPVPAVKPQRAAGDGDYVVWAPLPDERILPWSGPNKEDRARGAKLSLAGVAGQRIATQIAMSPFAELGESELILADLKSDAGTIPASHIQGYFKNYRFTGLRPTAFPRAEWPAHLPHEMVLLPSLKPNVEQGITQNFWLWLHVPADAKPGMYKATFTFKPAKGAATDIPVDLEVYPFKVNFDVPIAHGMYGFGTDPALATPELRKQVMRERFKWMRAIGFNALELPTPRVDKLEGSKVTLRLDPLPWETAKEVGMGKLPEQMHQFGLLSQLGRFIGKKHPSVKDPEWIDKPANIGIELTLEGFEPAFLDGATQLRDWANSFGMPWCGNVVDEPREAQVNPWNRTFDDTVKYIKLLRKVGGIKIAENPMRDFDRYNKKRDFTEFLDHVDIYSTHAWPESAKGMKLTLEKGKTLWLYNTGMGRFSWGFYQWASQAKGRWEWHFGVPSAEAFQHYPGGEWYNPLTGYHGFACNAPYTKYPSGILFQSVYLTAAEGMNDAAYIHTLLAAIDRHKKAGTQADSVAKAEKLLAEIKSKIPQFPPSKGLASGAEVAESEADATAHSTETWRRQIAEMLKALS